MSNLGIIMQLVLTKGYGPTVVSRLTFFWFKNSDWTVFLTCIPNLYTTISTASSQFSCSFSNIYPPNPINIIDYWSMCNGWIYCWVWFLQVPRMKETLSKGKYKNHWSLNSPQIQIPTKVSSGQVSVFKRWCCKCPTFDSEWFLNLKRNIQNRLKIFRNLEETKGIILR